MKKIKINSILAGALIAIGAFSFSSCLKNGTYYTDFSAVAASVDLPLAAANVNGPVPFSYAATAANPQIGVYVNLASPSTLGSAVTVTLAIDTAYLNAYNNANGTSYTLLPANCYTVSSLSLTIAAGQRLDSAIVKFIFSNFDFTQDYILPFTIVSASEPIEQWNHLMLNISVKNQFDDNYTCTGYVFHPSDPRAENATYAITTAGPYTCTFPFGDLGADGYLFDATINGTSGQVPLTNYVPEGSAPASSGFMTADDPGNTPYPLAAPNVPGVAPWVSSTYSNIYDYNAQTFWVHVGYIGGGAAGTSQNAYTRQFYLEFVAQ